MAILYGVFLLAVAAIVIFSGARGRRQLVLAVAAGGSASFLVRLVYAGYGDAELIILQALIFPFLALGTWLGLALISRFRDR